MSKKLYRVNVSYTCYVIAEDEAEAASEAADYVAASRDLRVLPVMGPYEILAEWRHDYPYNHDEDDPRTCWWIALGSGEE